MVNKIMAGVRNFKGTSRRRGVLLIIIGMLIAVVVIGLWVWQFWSAKPAEITAEGSAAAAIEYVDSRMSYKTKVIAVDARAKKLELLNIDLNTEQAYTYTNDTLFTKGLSNDEMAVDTIKKDDTLHIRVNLKTNTVETVWLP